jgi:tetratricopeptide (TPR) repeat protein
MPRLDGTLWLRTVPLTLALLIPCITWSWAAGPEDEVCDVNADYALGLEDYPAAIALHHRILRAHKDDALAHYHLGFAYGMTGRTPDEISEYLSAARLGLDKWDLFLNLGLAYLSQNDWRRAIEALHTAVSRGPDHPEAHFSLAIAYEKGNSLHEALREITASIHLAPEDLDERNSKAIICTELEDLVCARDEWARLVRVAPDYEPARVNLAILNGSHMRQPALTSTATEQFAVAP